MIKDNQKLLNRFLIVIDALLIILAFSLSYFLKFSKFSPLIKMGFLVPKFGYFSHLMGMPLHFGLLYQDICSFTTPATSILQDGFQANDMSAGALSKQTVLPSCTLLQFFILRRFLCNIPDGLLCTSLF